MTVDANWFHCQAKPISRSDGRSAVACAAYRLGLDLYDEKYGRPQPYTGRGGVLTGFTLAPDNAPSWATDPAKLWNAVEVKENRKNSQLALEWEIALPHAFDDQELEVVGRRITAWFVDRYGVAVSSGIHRDKDGLNDHMHLQMTTRAIGEDWAKGKLRQFNCRPGQTNPEVDYVREQVAGMINAALEESGSSQRITHLSYEARGIDREPTEHVGPKASEMEQREPGSSDRVRRNREISDRNQLDDLVAELAALDADIANSEEARLDGLYGPEEGHQQPPASDFEKAIQHAIDALDSTPEPDRVATPTPAEDPPSLTGPAGRSFDAAVGPAIASVGRSGETSPGARRRWKQMIKRFWHGTERMVGQIADLGRSAVSSWQRHVGRRAGRERDGPDR